jgi:hypothetical protein
VSIPGYDAWKTADPPEPEMSQCNECREIHDGSEDLCEDCLKNEEEAEALAEEFMVEMGCMPEEKK